MTRRSFLFFSFILDNSILSFRFVKNCLDIASNDIYIYIFGNFVNCVKPSRTIFERRKLNLKIYGFFLRDYFVIIKNIRREIKIVLSSRAIVPLSVKKKKCGSFHDFFSSIFSGNGTSFTKKKSH